MFKALFSMSLAGTAVVLAWLVLCRLAGNRFSARWQYRMLKLALAFLLVPVGAALHALRAVVPAAPVPTPALPLSPIIPEAAIPALPMPTPPPPVISLTAPSAWTITADTAALLVMVWAIGAVGMLAYKLSAFLRFRRHLHQAGLTEAPPQTTLLLRVCQQRLGVLCPVQVRLSPAVPTPFVMGLLRPVIVLPEKVPFSREELRYILLHELTHLKHGDLWVRRASLLALALHWWNPAAHLLDRKIIDLSEQSCDEHVATSLSHQERVDYGQMLLRLACAPSVPEELAAPLSTPKTVQRRLFNMLHIKNMTAKQKLLALAAVLVLLVCGTATALAVKAPTVTPEVPTSPGKDPLTPVELLNDQKEPESPAANPSKETPAVLDTFNDAQIPLESSQQTASPNISVPIPAEYQNAVRGDTALILARGGTLLPDDDPESYYIIAGVAYKLFITKDSTPDMTYVQKECEVGNWDLLPDFKQKQANETLVDGDYPRNSKGETYGHSSLAHYVGYHPDLVRAKGTHGELGYTRETDVYALPHNLPADQCPHEFTVPLYDSEGNVIGEFPVGCGGHFSGGMTIDEAKEALAEEDSMSNEELRSLLKARQLLSAAFGFDASGTAPSSTQESPGLLHISYLIQKGPLDQYTVDLTEDGLFPITLYHFCHSNEEEQVDLAADDSFTFDDRLVDTAKSFVRRVYGVDCIRAEVHAYCYQNKVCVELIPTEDQIFHVRFYYKDSDPTGVLYFSNQTTAQASMEVNLARQLF